MTFIRPPFVPFDERRATRIYQRNLPHWRQEGVTYFVTFRLGDSIPEQVRRRWDEEKSAWLRARGIDYDGETGRWHLPFEKLAAADRFAFQKHFNRKVQSCLDRGLGNCYLRNLECIKIVRSKLLDGDGSRFHMGDFVIMPNHVHVLVTPSGEAELEMILKGVKGASAVSCNRLLGRTGTFWQADSYDHIVRSLEQLHDYRRYIADNPGSAGITVPATACYVVEWMNNWLES